jgi:hypothetical protein
MYARASRFQTGQFKSTQRTVIEHGFVLEFVEETFKQKLKDEITREEYASIIDKRFDAIIQKHPYNESTDVMPFGMYKGDPIIDIFNRNPDYLLYILWIKRSDKNFIKLISENCNLSYLIRKLVAIQ